MRAALKLALEMVQNKMYAHAEMYLKEALAQPEQEAVARSEAYAMIDKFLGNNLNSDADYAEYSKALDSIYLTPPQRTWVGLTDEEVDELHGSPMELEHSGALKWVRIIEEKLKEKNT